LFSGSHGDAKNLTMGEGLPELVCMFPSRGRYSHVRQAMATQQQSYWTQRTLKTTCKRHVLLSRRQAGILCLKSKQKLIDAKRLCSEEMSETIVPLQVISRCDHNSGFYGASKKLIAGRLIKSKEARKLLSECRLQPHRK